MFTLTMKRSANPVNISSEENKYWGGEFSSRYPVHQLSFI